MPVPESHTLAVKTSGCSFYGNMSQCLSGVFRTEYIYSVGETKKKINNGTDHELFAFIDINGPVRNQLNAYRN